MLAVLAVMAAAVSAVAALSGCNECVMVDLSHWNQNLDWDKAVKEGLQGVIHKASQGGNFRDDDYATRQAEVKRLDLKWGAYHFGDASADAKVQVENFLSVVGPTKRLLAFDYEPYSSSMKVEEAEKFVEEVATLRGKYPLVYGSSRFLAQVTKGRPSSSLFKCPLWLAQWGPKPEVPPGWSNWTIWQYTDGKVGPEPYPVPGLGVVDRSRYNSALYPSFQALWDALKL